MSKARTQVQQVTEQISVENDYENVYRLDTLRSSVENMSIYLPQDFAKERWSGVIKAVKDNSALKKLTIYGPSLDTIFADSICDVIKEHRSVVEFHVGRGSVKFGQKFVDLVNENKVIQVLHCSGSGNAVDAAYFSSLCQAIQGSVALRSINFDMTLSEDQMISMLEAAHLNRSIKSVSFQWSRSGDLLAKEVTRILQDDTAITSFNLAYSLGYKDLSDGVLNGLVEAMRLNTKCVSMYCTREEYAELWERFTFRNKQALLEQNRDVHGGDAHSVAESDFPMDPAVAAGDGVKGCGDDLAVASAAPVTVPVVVCDVVEEGPSLLGDKVGDSSCCSVM